MASRSCSSLLCPAATSTNLPAALSVCSMADSMAPKNGPCSSETSTPTELLLRVASDCAMEFG